MNMPNRTMWMLCAVAALVSAGSLAAEQRGAEPGRLQTWRRFARDLPGDRLSVSRYYPSVPSRDERDAAVRVDKEFPKKVQLGETYTYVIRVKNLRRLPIDNVAYVERAGEGSEIVVSEPAGEPADGGAIRWELGEIGPEAHREIEVTARANRAGAAFHSGVVEYARPLAAAVEVAHIKVALEKSLPKEVLLGETIPVRLTVRNEGTLPATEVEVRDDLPDGLATTDGKNTVVARFGDLAPGQARTSSYEAKAARVGSFASTAVLTVGGKASDRAEATVRVTQPELSVSAAGPERVREGRVFTHRFTVANTGDGEARETVVDCPVPANAALVEAVGGQALEDAARWEVGALAKGESKTVEMRLKATAQGTVRTAAMASAHFAEPAGAWTSTVVEGVAAVLLGVVDEQDPVPVGEQTTYAVTVTSQGSKPNTNVLVMAELDDAMEFVAATGPTEHKVLPDRIEFHPLPSLAAGKEATWRVTVRALRKADARFKVVMDSEQLTRPVLATEATTFYE